MNQQNLVDDIIVAEESMVLGGMNAAIVANEVIANNALQQQPMMNNAMKTNAQLNNNMMGNMNYQQIPNVNATNNAMIGSMALANNMANNMVTNNTVFVSPNSNFGYVANDYTALFNNQTRCLVTQDADFFEIFSGMQQERHFRVRFGNNFQCAALEESGWFSRQFLGKKRPFTMRIRSLDGNRDEILKIERPFAWFLPELSVYDPKRNDALLGRVVHTLSWCERNMDVFDGQGNLIYKIHGPCCNPWSFYIEKDDQRVGVIRKSWSGFMKELVLNATENFGVEFPVNATPQEKAILFGATFLIDFMYFEHKDGEDEQQNNRGMRFGYNNGW